MRNPSIMHRLPLHQLKVTVWCVIWSKGFIESYFFENENGCFEISFHNKLFQETVALVCLYGCPMKRSSKLFSSWGYLRNKFYANKPESLEELRQNIRNEINEICREMCGFI